MFKLNTSFQHHLLRLGMGRYQKCVHREVANATRLFVHSKQHNSIALKVAKWTKCEITSYNFLFVISRRALAREGDMK